MQICLNVPHNSSILHTKPKNIKIKYAKLLFYRYLKLKCCVFKHRITILFVRTFMYILLYFTIATTFLKYLG